MWREMGDGDQKTHGGAALRHDVQGQAARAKLGTTPLRRNWSNVPELGLMEGCQGRRSL